MAILIISILFNMKTRAVLSKEAENIPDYFSDIKSDMRLKTYSELPNMFSIDHAFKVSIYTIFSAFSDKPLQIYTSYKDLENYVDHLQQMLTKNSIDVIIGIASGGKFIVYMLKAKYPDLSVGYIHIKRNIPGLKMTMNYINKTPGTDGYKIVDFSCDHNIADKSIALVDDAILSGGTMQKAVDFLNSKGAKNVSKYVLHGTKHKKVNLISPKLHFIGPWGVM